MIPPVKKSLNGSIIIPSDKSVSHRAVMFASLAKGESVIHNFSRGADPISSMEICSALGADIKFSDSNTLIVNGKGLLSKPVNVLNCGNSGTTMRFMCGILAGQTFDSVLMGDESLSKRPMKRVIEPLTLMGANIISDNYHEPIKISGADLHGISYSSKISSAQVKSCLLLAGLNANGLTEYTEPSISRNHSELMLKYMNADIETFGTTNIIRKSVLEPQEIHVIGDISSAAYFIVAANILPNSDIIIRNVGLNATRTGIIDVIKAMGGNIEILDKKIVSNELVGDLRVRYSQLKACTIEGEIIPQLIDELPIISVLATQAEGQTIIKNAEDLKNKETNRITAMVTELKKVGADIVETEDGFIINGKTKLQGDAEINTYFDHRIAMSMYVAGLVCEKSILIKDFEWVNISFPEFEKLFNRLMQ